MGYWIASAALIVFGILGSMTIGQPFVIVGLAMVVLGPFRHRPLVFWPPMLAVIAYTVTFWAISPLYCSATSPAGGPTGPTTCSSLIGIPWPATAGGVATSVFDQTKSVGLLVAAIVFIVVLAALLWRRQTQSPA